MTVMIYPTDGRESMRVLSNTITHAYCDLLVGSYNTIVFNQSAEEFGSVSFVGMDDFSTAEITTNVARSTWYESRAEKVALHPEWVGVDAQRNGIVSKQMLDATIDRLVASAYSRAASEFVLASHTPQNIIHTITVKVHLSGIYNLRSARAALTGLADAYSISRASTTAVRCTQLLESWSVTVDEADPTKGYITSKISSLGLPEDFAGLAADNELLLSVLLVDNATVVDIPFTVGDKWKYKYDEQGNMLLEFELELELWADSPLPDVEPVDYAGGGFDATVDDWGDIQHVDIGV